MWSGDGIQDVTPRERHLLRRLEQGRTDREIAREMGETERRIVAQRQSMAERLQITSHAQLVAWADLLRWPRGEDAKSKGAPER
jgi:DNA-binding CsgD family transcriptional regulator